MKGPFGLYSFEYGISGICTRKELVEEGNFIIDKLSLPSVTYTRQDMRDVWRDYYRDYIDKGIASLVTQEVRKELREKYDWDFLRMLCWLYEWLGLWAEMMDLDKKRPRELDYTQFFTIRAVIGELDFRQVNLSECVKYMRQREMQRWKMAHTDSTRRNSGKQKVRAYMREHPEEVEEIRRRHEQSGRRSKGRAK